jgi:NH3-dependent NAD+ synthetase
MYGIDWPAGDNNKDYRPIVGLSKTKTSQIISEVA